MSDLLPTLSSDEEDNADAVVASSKRKRPRSGGRKKPEKKTEKDDDDDDAASSGDEVDMDFEFGGALGEDGFSSSLKSPSSGNAWSYKSALKLLDKVKADAGFPTVERTATSEIVAEQRKRMRREAGEADEEVKEVAKAADAGADDADDDDEDEDDYKSSTDSDSGTESESVDEDKQDAAGSGSGSGSDSGSDSDSDSSSDEEDNAGVDDADREDMDDDVLKERSRSLSKMEKREAKARAKAAAADAKEGSDADDGNEGESSENESSDDDDDSDGDGANSDDDDEARAEASKAAQYFDSRGNDNANDDDDEEITSFPQLGLSRPLLRGVASVGFVTPTPIQAHCIPVAMAGRDICASAVTGSGKTAAFLLPVLERILQRGGGSGGGGKYKSGNKSQYAATRALVLTPTRELAAQCVAMMMALVKFTDLTATLVVGGTKNSLAQAAELRARPDVVVATPGRLLDHVTNSQGVHLDDVEFLILDEADRLLDLGFQDEVHEIVKACQPEGRQTLLFSATMGTKVDDLIKLSLKKPVRVAVTDKKRRGAGANAAVGTSRDVEVADRLEQEFVRVRGNNEGAPREAMLLSLLTRTFTARTISFFDTKAKAHRMMIVAGLCGIKCAELHGNLTQTQRLEALESFREGEVDVLLATDLAARGLDISGVDAVINFEMPSNVETYVHRIGRTARAGRAGSACTLIGEGRRHLMKSVIRDAAEKSRRAADASGSKKNKDDKSGVIRSRIIPPAVVSHFTAKVNSLEPHVEEVLAAEAVARMDRIAEMEMTRASNIIKHGEEIERRPKKEWFSTAKERISLKEATAEKARRIEEAVGTGKHRMTRKKRRAREAKEEMLEAQQEMREEAEETGGETSMKGIVTDETMKTSARAQKREKERRGVGAGKSVHEEDQERSRKRKVSEYREKKKRKGAFATDSLGSGGLFDEEKVAHSAKKTAKEVRAEQKPKSAYDFTEFDPSKMGHKGKKKGNKKFKSKSKHKRR